MMRVKEEREKAGLSSTFKKPKTPKKQKTKIIASGPITSWKLEREKIDAMTDFLFEGSKITVDGDCSPEVKRGSLLGRKAMTNLGSAFKNRDITLLTKVCLVKAMVLPEVMYGCACWTIKVEH